MATGKTNARFIKVFVDDENPTARDISASVASIDNFGLTYATQDVTGYTNGWTNVTLGHAGGDVTITGPVDNTADIGSHDVFSAIVGIMSSTFTLTVQIGIRTAAVGGEPEWEGEYYCSAYTVDGDANYTATLVPADGTVGAWGTV